MPAAPVVVPVRDTAPLAHPNLILGSLQLLVWLFLHPSAWRAYVAGIDPALTPLFSLAELRAAHWRNRALQRLLLQGYGLLPLLLVVALRLSGVSWSDIAYGLTLGLAFGVPVGLGVGVALGIGATLIIGGAVSFTVAITGGYASPDALGLALGLTSIMAGGLAPSGSFTLAARQIGRGLIGVLAAGVVIGAAFGGLALLTGSAGGGLRQVEVEAGSLFLPYGLTPRLAISLAWGIATAVGGAVPIGLAVFWRTRRPRRALALGGLVWLVLAVLVTVAYAVEGHVETGISDLGSPLTHGSIGLTTGVFFSWYFIIAFVLGEWLGGSVAGRVAGALGGGLGWEAFWLMGELAHPWPDLAQMLYSLGLGITFLWWGPILYWPLELAWANILYQIERRRRPGQLILLYWHPAYWDEIQFLPLYSLDEYLVLISERHPALGQAAFIPMVAGRQRWAIQAAQIELDARQLERCTAIGAIRQAGQHLLAEGLDGPATALLRSFGRISRDVDAALRQQSVYNQRLALSAVEDRLDNLIRELNRSSERYASRFYPIVSHWRQIVAAQVLQLATASELRQEIDNPYIIGLPLTAQQEIFVGRTDISARIEQLLLDRRRPPLLLYGQRRMGKTSLLHNLSRLLPSTIVPLFVDLQGAASQASDHAGFLYNLAADMTKGAREQRGLALPPLPYESLQTDPFTFFNRWLDGVETALGTNTALLELDELETLDQALSEGRFSEWAVLGLLRHLIQHRPRFKVLLAGAHTLDELQRWAGYLINVQMVPLSYLHPDEARRLIEAPVQDFALRYEPAACRRVLDLTRGHPLLVQLLCAEIVALKNEQELTVRRLAGLADVEAAVPAALRSGSLFFADIMYNQIDPAGRGLLHYVAAQGPQAVIDPATLAAQIPDATDHTLGLLLRRELVEAVDGGYRFQVELIRRWFAQATPLSTFLPPG